MPGEPVIIALGPSLPAEATTIVPARAALSAAMASRVVPYPKVLPSDMLITSAPSFTARSMPAATSESFAEPSHPNTRYAISEACGAEPGPMSKVVPARAAFVYGPPYVVPPSTPKPAAVPETCEP